MHPGHLLLFVLGAGLALGPAARAADKPATAPSDDISPLEKHPECMERTAKAESSKCIIQDVGTPRHKFPPKPPLKSVPKPAPKPTPAAPATGTAKP